MYSIFTLILKKPKNWFLATMLAIALASYTYLAAKLG